MYHLHISIFKLHEKAKLLDAALFDGKFKNIAFQLEDLLNWIHTTFAYKNAEYFGDNFNIRVAIDVLHATNKTIQFLNSLSSRLNTIIDSYGDQDLRNQQFHEGLQKCLGISSTVKKLYEDFKVSVYLNKLIGKQQTLKKYENFYL